ncbi:unnamed protein product [Darwinula stevensoni]|uniref:Uncharacterized protein n=1 Tax=Darwinula stevensoni TaxID=69355 RepID=A0A7R9AI27_9CRUS|nr:unnamed protein product [Darwinula stevensoni]CAG0905744.1 unnamed protein product [Darwinula stevensoni]
MTREVLVERRALAENLKKLQEQIPRAASSLTALQKECRLLREKREEVTKVADVAEERVKIPLEKEKAINCNECSRTTCEYPASISKPRDVKHCHCMTRNEQKKMICSKCGCSWRSHSLDAKRYEEKSIFRSKTQENSERVTEHIKTQVNLEKKVLELTTKIKKNQVQLFAQIQKAHKTTARLKEIALNPNPLTMEEYIEFLIEAERKGAEDGFKNRIAHLEEAKRASAVCKQILDENGSNEAIMPNVMTILEKENIDFETLGVVETPGAAMHQPNSMVGTLKAFFISILGRNSRKT